MTRNDIRPVRATRRPFTVIVCTSCAASAGEDVLQTLGASVRRCANGVLVTTGCLLGATTCGPSRPSGVTVALQPCTIDRRSVGRVRWLGPVDGARDVRALCRWVERGDWDAPLLLTWDARTSVGSSN
jgi:hypothetical protein